MKKKLGIFILLAVVLNLFSVVPALAAEKTLKIGTYMTITTLWPWRMCMWMVS